MRGMHLVRLSVVASVLSMVGHAAASPNPTAFGYQGRLEDGATPASGLYDFRFRLFDDALAGLPAGDPICLDDVEVAQGLFSVTLDFGQQFQEGSRFLEIDVRQDAGTDCSDGTQFTTLSPRQPLLASPYAAGAWGLGGNAGLTGGFLGTTDAAPLELRVNNRRVLRYSEHVFVPSGLHTVNTVSGSYGNSIAPGAYAATISGGGQVTAAGQTHGANHVLGGGFSVIAGGGSNTVNSEFSTVSGGSSNAATGYASTVAGGTNNTAAGSHSFAAGRAASALHPGSFVWGDFSSGAISSTASNQFVIQAAGGVKLHTGAVLELGFNTPGKEANAGKIGYQAFTAGTLDIVGAGTSAGNRRIKLHAEGGASVSGPLGVGVDNPQARLHIKGNQNVLALEGIDHAYMEFYPRLLGSGRKAYIGFPASGSRDLVIANEDTGVLRVVGTFVNNSDARQKADVRPLEGALEKVVQLRGVTYAWRRDAGDPAPVHAQRQVGFLAQDVEQVAPDLVYTDADGAKSVAYLGVVPMLVESIKTMQAESEAAQQRLRELEERKDARIADLEARLMRLEQRLEAESQAR